MKNLYTLAGLNELLACKKKYKNFLFSCIILFVVSMTLLIIFSTYKQRAIFIPITIAIGLTLTLLIIYFIINVLHYAKISREYDAILNKKGEIVEVELVDISINPITLADKSRVFEVSTSKDGKGKYYYLSILFDENEIIKGKCKLLVAFDYIKGYEYEK